jgi:hypothetical protein
LGIHISYEGGITTIHANEFLGEKIIHVGNFKPFGDIILKKNTRWHATRPFCVKHLAN